MTCPTFPLFDPTRCQHKPDYRQALTYVGEGPGPATKLIIICLHCGAIGRPHPGGEP